MEPRSNRFAGVLGVGVFLIMACGGDDSADSQAASGADPGGTTVVDQGDSTAMSVPLTVTPSAPLTLTAADLDGFEKGLAREIELVRAAKDRASKATDPKTRGEAIQAAFEQNTMNQAAPMSGLSAERYGVVRQHLHELLQTLDFQGKIDGPMSLDTARADAASKARLASDPYATLDPAGAAALKSRLSRIVSVWVRYITLTIAGG